MTDSRRIAGAHTIAEIFSEPETWSRCLAELETENGHRAWRGLPPSDDERVFIGCGSSFYLAIVAASTWSLLTGEAARAIPASEILLFPDLIPHIYSSVLISRSGYTSEIIEVGRYLKQRNRTAQLAITCGVHTSIEDLSPNVICLPQADEKSTVMTRSFTSMLLALQLLAAKHGARSDFAGALRNMPAMVEPAMQETDAIIRSIVGMQSFADYVFLGQGPFYGVAQEAMLKVKEMSASYAQCFHTLEFRHGPKASVSRETLVTFFLSESGFESELSVLQEIKQLGATTLVVTNDAHHAVKESADYLVELSLRIPEAARAAAAVIPGQLLGYHTGMRKGLDPDNPRNLSRVVVLQGAGDGRSPASSD